MNGGMSAFGPKADISAALSDHWERKRKRLALPRLRLDPDLATVHLNDAFGYGESQAGATLLASDRIVGLLEFLKPLGLIGSRNPRTGVPDRDME